LIAQLSGELAEVRVSDGDLVQKGDVLAVIDARRESAAVAVAEANLAAARVQLERVRAGTGDEEIEAAARAAESAKARMEAHRARIKYMRKCLKIPSRPERQPDRALSQSDSRIRHYESLVKRYNESENSSGSEKAASLSSDELADLEEAEYQLESLEKSYQAMCKRLEALRRGPLPKDIEAAEAAVKVAEKQLDEAQTNYDYRQVTAPFDGTVLKVYRHAGDSVQAGAPTPVVCLADTEQLRVRLEVNETEVDQLKTGMKGDITVRGNSQTVGHVEIREVIPVFGPKRLFNADTSVRVDTRTLDVLCEVETTGDVKLFPGQRLTAEFTVDP
jgi:multidrug resistance efflux pump